MYVRCTDCLASTWTEVVQEDRLVDAVECGACGRRAVLEPVEELGCSVREHYLHALDFANGHDMDIASAYSVLLGIMSREQAEVLQHSNVAPAPPAPADDPVLQLEAEAEASPASSPVLSARLPLVPDFDLGFTKAIAEGHLTVQQAMTRGDRDAFASRLQSRHRFSEAQAYEVTDNRLSLRDALRQNEERLEARSAGPPDLGGEARSPSTRLQTLAVLGVAVVILTFATWRSWSEQFVADRSPVLRMSGRAPRVAPGDEGSAARSATNEARLLDATRVRTDAMGRVIEVTGPDPRSVLIAYCEASDSILGLSPLEITSTVPRFRRARLGLFRDFGALDTTYAIRIRRDASTGRWSAGGPSDAPIPVKPAPRLPPDAIRIPVSN